MKCKTFWRKLTTVALAGVLALSVAGCGKTNGENNESGEVNGGAGELAVMPDYLYVPEFKELNIKRSENEYASGFNIVNGKLHYMIVNYGEEGGSFRLATRDLSTDQEVISDMGEDFQLSGNPLIDEEGNLYAITDTTSYNWSDDSEEPEVIPGDVTLFKYDSTGAVIQEKKLEGFKESQDEYGYVQNMILDGKGHIICYYSNNNDNKSFFYVLSLEGEIVAKIPCDCDWVMGLTVSKEGKVVFAGSGRGNATLTEIDVENKKIGKTYSDNIPYFNNGMCTGINKGVLIPGNAQLVEFDLETGKMDPILSWTDSNIQPDYINAVSPLPDGRIALVLNNWETEEIDLVYLTRKASSELTEKKIIVVGTLFGDQSLQNAVVKFNKNSDKYMIRIQTYFDENTEWTDTKYEDAIKAMNNAVTSNNCPDIMALDDLHYAALAKKGAFVDLNQYLDKSTKVKRADLVESVLKGYTVDDKLIAIPSVFYVTTMIAKKSIVGDKEGITVKDCMELSKKYPGSQLIYYGTKNSVLKMLLSFSVDSYIDYAAGTCKFNTPEFIDLLTFANTFPEEDNYNDEVSYPKMIRENEILLLDGSAGDLEQLQLYRAMMGEDFSFIGYPTADGTPGHFISGYNGYAIMSKASDPDGAWTFIESLLEYREVPRYGMYNLPIRKDMLEEYFKLKMEPNYVYDENDEIVLDEDGNPKEYPVSTWGWDDFNVEIYSSKPEEIARVRDLISKAKVVGAVDEELFKMISEEAAAYFKGQKGAEEVAKIIQSRISIYMSENN